MFRVKRIFNKLRYPLISIFNLILLLIDIYKMRFLHKQNKNAYKRLLRVFYFFGGTFNPIISKILGKPKFDFEKVGLLSKLSNQELEKAESHLKKEGFVVFENILTPELCEEFIKMSLKIPGITRVMDGEKGERKSMYFDRNNPQSVRFDYSASDLVSNEIVQKLISDESIFDFAQRYLGAAPILDLVAMWWHTTFSDLADKQAAQWFHFDMERVKWIKFFFYITDVDENSGPHTFVPKTHSKFGIPSKLRRRGYVRLADSEVEEYFPVKEWKEFVGKRGTLIVEDTRGLHKGKHCKSGDRLLFQLEFTTSKFGAMLEEVNFKRSTMTPELKSIKNKYESIYSMINFLDKE